MRLLGGRKRQTPTRREVAERRRSESVDAKGAFVPVNLYHRGRVSKDGTGHSLAGSSERQAAWSLRKQRRRLVKYLAATLAMALAMLLILTQLVIDVSVVPTGRKLSHDQEGQYSAVLEKYFRQRPIERLRFLIDESALRAFFLEESPEVQSVQVSSGSKLTHGSLKISFRQPVAQWSSSDKVYYVDNTGMIFEKSYFDSPGIIVSDQSGVPAYAGQEAANRKFLSFLGRIISLFGDEGIVVTEAIIPQDTVRQVEFRLEGRSYRVKMTVDRSAESQAEEAMHAVRYLDERSIHPEYVDVRVNQRVFYR